MTVPLTNREARVLVVGCGNIGSHLVPLLSRNPGIQSLILVDHDRFEARNLSSQAICRDAVGQPKATFLAETVKRIRPDLRVIVHPAAVEWLPLGQLRADVMVACVDSRRARQVINQAAWRLGIPWIDTAVGPDDMLARVGTYLPSHGNPCLECGWSQSDYDNLEQVLACNTAQTVETASTAGPAELGALAAALAAVECDKLIRGDLETSLAGKQLMIGVRYPSHDVTQLQHNPECRFDHETLSAKAWPSDIENDTLGEVLAGVIAGSAACLPADSLLGVEGFSLSQRQACSCGREQDRLEVAGRPAVLARKCPGCGKPMRLAGFHTRSQIPMDQIQPEQRSMRLAEIGLQWGNILTLQSNGSRLAFELFPLPTREKDKPDPQEKDGVAAGLAP